MKLALACVLVGALVGVATGDVPNAQTYVLTTIDQVPTKGQLDSVLMPSPAQQLIDFALNDADIGVRLRAINALSNYCTPCAANDPVHTTLTGLIGAHAGAHSGAELLLLRAAIEADGPLKLPDDLDLFRTLHLLDHPSRDIRAATARALAELRNCQATNDLRLRYQNESADQVKLAISGTLRILSQPNYCLVN